MALHEADGEDAERDAVAHARTQLEKKETREAAEEAYVNAAIVKLHMRGIGTSLAALHENYGQVLGEMGRLADAAVRGVEANAQAISTGFAGLDALLTERIGNVASRIDAIEEENEQMRKKSPDDSMVDVYERLPPEEAEIVRSSRAKWVHENQDLRATVEQLERKQELSDARDEATAEANARHAAAATQKKLDEATARKERRSTIITIGAVLSIVVALVTIAQVVIPHLK